MNIQLKGWNITNLSLSVLNDESKRDDNSFSLETGNYFSDQKDDNSFGVEFKIKISDQEFNLVIEAIFHFELVDEKISEAFKLSSLPKVNAPAIAFPFIRAYISNLTLQSGFKPVMLPSINFAKLASQDNASAHND